MGLWTTFHPAVFFLTFISFSLYHTVRRTPSYVQSSLISEWTPATEHHMLGHTTSISQSLFQDHQSAEEFIGILNAIFLFVYAAGNLLSGMLADRVDLRLFLTAGMTLSAVVMFIFGPVLEWTGSKSQGAYIVLQILSALFQSTGWPCLVPVVASWFNKRSSRYILGFWSSSPSVGSILGALIVSAVVDYGYEYAFVLTCSLLLAGAVMVFFGLVTSPREAGLVIAAHDDSQSDDKTDDDDDNEDDDGNEDDINSWGEREMLLGKTSLHKTHVPHTSNSSSHYIHTDRACSTKYRLHTSKLSGFDPAVRCNYQKIQPSNEPIINPCTSQRNAQTISGDLVGGGDVDVETEHSCVDTGSDNGHEHKINEKHFSGIKCQSDSDVTTKSCEHDKSKIKLVYFQKVTHSLNHVNEQLQTNVSEDSDSDDSFKRCLIPQEGQERPAKQDSSNAAHARPKAISFIGALLLPGVIQYSFCAAFLKLVVYILFFWLPFYLASSRGWTESTADRLTLWYDVGAITGGMVSAFLMSKLNKTALIMAPMMLTSVPIFYLYGVLELGQNMTSNATMLFCLGFLLTGVSCHLSATVSADLSQREALRTSTNSMSTVTGILEGSGTVGAALGQIAVPYLLAASGWDSVFYSLMVAVCLSAASLASVLVSEVKEMVRHCGKQ